MGITDELVIGEGHKRITVLARLLGSSDQLMEELCQSGGDLSGA